MHVMVHFVSSNGRFDKLALLAYLFLALFSSGGFAISVQSVSQ